MQDLANSGECRLRLTSKFQSMVFPSIGQLCSSEPKKLVHFTDTYLINKRDLSLSEKSLLVTSRRIELGYQDENWHHTLLTACHLVAKHTSLSRKAAVLHTPLSKKHWSVSTRLCAIRSRHETRLNVFAGLSSGLAAAKAARARDHPHASADQPDRAKGGYKQVLAGVR